MRDESKDRVKVYSAIQEFIRTISGLRKFTYDATAKLFSPAEFARVSSVGSLLQHPLFGKVRVFDWPSGWLRVTMEIPSQIRFTMPEVESIVADYPFGNYKILHEDMVEAWYTQGVEYLFRVPAGELVLTFLDDQESPCETDHQHERIKTEVFAGIARPDCRLASVTIHNEPSEETKSTQETLASFRARNKPANTGPDQELES